jgi:prophage regulatory protein
MGTANFHGTTEIRLIRIAEVMNLTGLSRSYIYELANQGRFPLSVALVPGGVSRAWISTEVADWVGKRIAERELR